MTDERIRTEQALGTYAVGSEHGPGVRPSFAACLTEVADALCGRRGIDGDRQVPGRCPAFGGEARTGALRLASAWRRHRQAIAAGHTGRRQRGEQGERVRATAHNTRWLLGRVRCEQRTSSASSGPLPPSTPTPHVEVEEAD